MHTKENLKKIIDDTTALLDSFGTSILLIQDYEHYNEYDISQLENMNERAFLLKQSIEYLTRKIDTTIQRKIVLMMKEEP